MKDKEFLTAFKNEMSLRLENLNVEHQINIAVYEAKKGFLHKHIDLIERQLEGGKK